VERLENLADEGKRETNSGIESSYSTVVADSTFILKSKPKSSFSCEDIQQDMLNITDTQKVGILLTGFGLFFSLIGVLLFFDRGLLAIGNLLFLAGISLVIGTRKTVVFFFQRRKIRGTICFLGGILLVIIGWPFIGIVVEVFGFINLFGDFFPVALAFMRRLPIIGTFLNIPFVRDLTDRLVDNKRLPV